MTYEEELLTTYAANDKDRREGSTDAEVVQEAVSKELHELGFYIVADRDNPKEPVFFLQRVGVSPHLLYEVHGS